MEGNSLSATVVLAVIVFLAFWGNLLVLYVLITRASYLTHAYNVFIFSLALADIATSIFLTFSRFLFLPSLPDGELSREIYCRVIWSAVLIFDLNYISVYTALGLTVERWLAVVRPLVYRSIKPRQAVNCAVFVWFWGILVNLTVVFRVKFDKATQKCTWISLDVINNELPFITFVLQTAFPLLTITALYSHILYVLKRLSKTSSAALRCVRRATVTALATSAAMMVAAVPSRVTFLLSKLSVIDPHSLFHFCLVMLTLSSICFNPILYGIYNSQLRREYRTIFRKFRCTINRWAQNRLVTGQGPSFTQTSL